MEAASKLPSAFLLQPCGRLAWPQDLDVVKQGRGGLQDGPSGHQCYVKEGSLPFQKPCIKENRVINLTSGKCKNSGYKTLFTR